MHFDLPSTKSTVLIGGDVEQRAVELVRGHIANHISPNVLFIGRCVGDLGTIPSDLNVTFTTEDSEIELLKYSLVVVNTPRKSFYNNGIFSMDVPVDQWNVLNTIALVDVPFIGVMS